MDVVSSVIAGGAMVSPLLSLIGLAYNPDSNIFEDSDYYVHKTRNYIGVSSIISNNIGFGLKQNDYSGSIEANHQLSYGFGLDYLLNSYSISFGIRLQALKYHNILPHNSKNVYLRPIYSIGGSVMGGTPIYNNGIISGMPYLRIGGNYSPHQSLPESSKESSLFSNLFHLFDLKSGIGINIAHSENTMTTIFGFECGLTYTFGHKNAEIIAARESIVHKEIGLEMLIRNATVRILEYLNKESLDSKQLFYKNHWNNIGEKQMQDIIEEVGLNKFKLDRLLGTSIGKDSPANPVSTIGNTDYHTYKQEDRNHILRNLIDINRSFEDKVKSNLTSAKVGSGPQIALVNEIKKQFHRYLDSISSAISTELKRAQYQVKSKISDMPHMYSEADIDNFVKQYIPQTIHTPPNKKIKLNYSEGFIDSDLWNIDNVVINAFKETILNRNVSIRLGQLINENLGVFPFSGDSIKIPQIKNDPYSDPSVMSFYYSPSSKTKVKNLSIDTDGFNPYKLYFSAIALTNPKIQKEGSKENKISGVSNTTVTGTNSAKPNNDKNITVKQGALNASRQASPLPSTLNANIESIVPYEIFANIAGESNTLAKYIYDYLIKANKINRAELNNSTQKDNNPISFYIELSLTAMFAI